MTKVLRKLIWSLFLEFLCSFKLVCTFKTLMYFSPKDPFNPIQCKEKRLMLLYILTVVSFKPPDNNGNKVSTVIVHHSQHLSLKWTVTDRKTHFNHNFSVSFQKELISMHSYIFPMYSVPSACTTNLSLICNNS